jgi:hypothetical protein
MTRVTASDDRLVLIQVPWSVWTRLYPHGQRIVETYALRSGTASTKNGLVVWAVMPFYRVEELETVCRGVKEPQGSWLRSGEENTMGEQQQRHL